MTNKVLINGALMDQKFFDDNVIEARSVMWQEVDCLNIKNHAHCIVCTIALPTQNKGTVYRAGDRWLCSHCFSHYINVKQ